MIGSLILGVYDDHDLRYVGTGFTQAALGKLATQLQPLEHQSNPLDTTVSILIAGPRTGWSPNLSAR